MVNVDLSSVVNGHLDYMKQMDTILKAVGIKTKECRLKSRALSSTRRLRSRAARRQKKRGATRTFPMGLGTDHNPKLAPVALCS
ncbi:unnamed protein product, partial [Ranitomeya imitator]